MKTSNAIRDEFVKFFADRGHTFIRSAPVVPQDDPTLLFTNAGMNQFKSIFLGDNPKGLARAANSQKCMRVSGKHNDLEEVGRDHYHHTLFEMLGNWSFGDYYKKEAIKWAWELLTEVWGLPKDRLFATIHTSDDEAEEFWKTETDIPHDRIMRFGDESNFWEMGETGPCGPCSEIHFDMGDEATRAATYNDPVEGVNGENARYRELWNLVFIQYNREKSGALNPLPAKHVDTGMGFERIVAVIQGVESNYDTDLFQPIIKELVKMTGTQYDGGVPGTPFRVIADHIRALVFAITDGAFPSNEGRGYVMRRLLRRAYRFGREIGFKEPFLWKLVPVVIEQMGGAFPEIGQRRAFLEEVIRSEEERFGSTLEQGIEKFEVMVGGAVDKGDKVLAGADVFALYDTYGFPMDLTRLMAEEKGLSVDESGYEELMKRQRERAREARKSGADDGLTPEGWTELRQVAGTEFVGYDGGSADVNVCRYKMIDDDGGDSVNTYLFILDKSPFYAEAGGQVGDKGELVTSSGVKIIVDDVFKWNDLIVHRVKSDIMLTNESLSAPFKASIDSTLRSAIQKNHTATHLLQSALHKILGDHVQQSGSRVDSTGLRFDFTHFKGLDNEEIVKVEKLVNEWIMDNYAIETAVMDTAAAKAAGAVALFGEKYADTVRVVSINSVSKELCGGTHVSGTGQIGPFHITGEESVSAGVRRITAITGMSAIQYLIDKEKTVSALALMLKVGQDKVQERVTGLIDTVKELENKMKNLSAAKAADSIGEIFEEASRCASSLKYAVKNMGELNKESFSRIVDAISDKIRGDGLVDTVIVIGAKVDDKVMFAAGAGDDAVSKHGIHCGDIVKAAAICTGGGGGGSKTRAQAGGKDPAKLDDALTEAQNIIAAKIIPQTGQ
ncbi:MAG: alanine--tRNA ligase [Chitinispirillales bacterium]|jgi:alanyl-tRNA synthetase|nr:alanine--tRNA ligase [Chitinispirillales bacterium]